MRRPRSVPYPFDYPLTRICRETGAAITIATLDVELTLSADPSARQPYRLDRIRVIEAGTDGRPRRVTLDVTDPLYAEIGAYALGDPRERELMDHVWSARTR